MPFVSNAQRKYLFAKHPAIAERWAAHTPKGASLPEHVKKASAGLFKKLPKIAPGRIMGLLQKKAFGMESFDPRGSRHDVVSADSDVGRYMGEVMLGKSRNFKARVINYLRKKGPLHAAVARAISDPPPLARRAARVGYAAGLLSHLFQPIPGSAEAGSLVGTAVVSAPSVLKDYLRLRKSPRFMKRGTLEFGFFDELSKSAGDDDLPSGFERLLIKGLRLVGKNSDPAVVGKMHDIMRAVPQERKI